MTALREENPNMASTGIDGSMFRDVLGRFASGLVIVAGTGSDGPVGFTCQSFFSLSLDPPLVAISVRQASTAWAEIEARGQLTISVLSHGQDDIASKLGRAGADKFADIPWSPSPAGNPRINGALAFLDCEVEAVTAAGDHHVVVARVLDLVGHHGAPLLFYRGQFGAFRL